MRVRTAIVGVVLSLLASGAAVTGWSPPVSALTFSARVSGTGGLGLFVRPGPSQYSGSPVGTLAEGQYMTIDCYVYGQTVAGYWYTGSLWHHVTSPVVGYVSDTYVYTGVNGPMAGEPMSGSAPAPAPTPAPLPTPGPQIASFYNRTAAKNW